MIKVQIDIDEEGDNPEAWVGRMPAVPQIGWTGDIRSLPVGSPSIYFRVTAVQMVLDSEARFEPSYLITAERMEALS